MRILNTTFRFLLLELFEVTTLFGEQIKLMITPLFNQLRDGGGIT